MCAMIRNHQFLLKFNPGSSCSRTKNEVAILLEQTLYNNFIIRFDADKSSVIAIYDGIVLRNPVDIILLCGVFSVGMTVLIIITPPYGSGSNHRHSQTLFANLTA